MSFIRRLITLVALVALIAAGCGSDDATEEVLDDQVAAPGADGEDRPTIVVSTNILGDVVTQLVGDQAEVVTIMPVGADPHDFQPSAQEVDQILRADALITNGGGFEEGLLDVFESAEDEGVPTVEALDFVQTIDFADGGHDDDHDHEDEHGDEDHEDEHGDEDHEDGHDDHDHSGLDPHFFTDPGRMADAVDGIVAFLGTEVDGLDQALLATAAENYQTELAALDAEVQSLIDAIPSAQRILITNHEVFGYFAEHYGFEVVGAVIPAGSTVEGSSAGELAELAELIEAEGVPAIFADASASSDLAQTLADEVGDIEVVELYSESLGEADTDGATYLDMVRTNASRISAALQ